MFKELVPGAVGQAHTTLSGGHFLQVTPPPRSTTLLGPVPLPVAFVVALLTVLHVPHVSPFFPTSSRHTPAPSPLAGGLWARAGKGGH